jgi:hypothetical protein
LRQLSLAHFIGEELNMINEEVEKDQLTKYQLLIQLKTLYKITDKLEKRIVSLEKVLESHAKCIGEMRDNNE